MLINLNFNFNKVLEPKICFTENDDRGYTYLMSNPKHEIWQGDKDSHCVFYIKKHEDGIYEGPMSFEQDISQYINYEIMDYIGFIKKNGLIFEQVNPNDKNFVLSYGIADNLEQIKSYYSDLIANYNHKYIISFTQINSQKEYDKLLLDLSPYTNYIGLNKQIKKFQKPILTFKLHILKEKQFKTMYQKNIFIS